MNKTIVGKTRDNRLIVASFGGMEFEKNDEVLEVINRFFRQHPVIAHGIWNFYRQKLADENTSIFVGDTPWRVEFGIGYNADFRVVTDQLSWTAFEEHNAG